VFFFDISIMPYYQEFHECAGFPVVELRYEPTHEEYLDYIQELKEGCNAHDEFNFFGFIDNETTDDEIPFSDEPTADQARAEYEELQELLCCGYTGAEF
jgi:hypothetical protein